MVQVLHADYIPLIKHNIPKLHFVQIFIIYEKYILDNA